MTNPLGSCSFSFHPRVCACIQVPESVSFHPPPITKSSKAYKSLYEDEIDTDTPILASALLRLTTPTTLPAADQAAALQSALDRAAAADSVSTCLYLHLTDFTLGPELERVLAGAKASGRDVRVSMVGGRCSRRGLALAAPLPPFTRLELVGMCGEDTAATHTDTAALGWLGEAAAGQWVVSVRQLLRLLHCCGGADTVTLQDCELVFSFDGSEEVGVSVCVRVYSLGLERSCDAFCRVAKYSNEAFVVMNTAVSCMLCDSSAITFVRDSQCEL